MIIAEFDGTLGITKTHRLYDVLLPHLDKARQQFEKGATVGRRQTPVVSFWEMRPKWEKWGKAWETVGTDGDCFWETNEKFIVPAVLKLVYFRMNDGRVCQLAYEIVPEKLPSSAQDRVTYETARCQVPKRLIEG